MNWISVKDKLPDNNKGVLVYSTEFGILYYYLRAKDGVWVQNGIDSVPDSPLVDITHWMPLPKKP